MVTIEELNSFVKTLNAYVKTLPPQYKVVTMPQTQVTGDSIAYTGFSKDMTILTSEAKWAIKKTLQDTTETWVGRYSFDQILDNYLSLSYS